MWCRVVKIVITKKAINYLSTLKLIKKPVCPKWSPWIQIRLQKGDPEEWKIYLGGDSQQLGMVG
jgi:hypothetical protein